MNGIIWVLVPITIFMIPIIAILTHHQQKMAEIINRNQRPAIPNEDIAALRQEIQALKEIVHQQAIALDGRSPLRDVPPPAPADVTQRLNG